LIEKNPLFRISEILSSFFWSLVSIAGTNVLKLPMWHPLSLPKKRKKRKALKN